MNYLNMKMMKTRLTLTVLIALLSVVFFSVETVARSEDYTKTFKEEYKVNKDAELHVSNKFGEVICRNWNEDKVSIEVTITVDASSDSKAQKVLDRIDVKLSGNASKVEGITVFEEGKDFGNVDFSIDYMIMLPKSMSVNIENKFGNIALDEVDGKALIDIAYGAVEANALNNTSNKLFVKFSEVNIEYAKEAWGEIVYSEFDIEGSDNLDLNTKFSEIDIENAGKLKILSQYDDYSIERSGPVECEAKFTDIQFERLDGSFNFDLQYGDLEVENVARVEGRNEIRNSFCDVSLGIENGASFYVDAEVKFGSMDYPENNTEISHTEEGYTTNVYKGTFGRKASESNMLYIRTKNASVKFE